MSNCSGEDCTHKSHDGQRPQGLRRRVFTPPTIPTARLYQCLRCKKQKLSKYDRYDEDGTIITWSASGGMVEHELADGTKVTHETWDDMCVSCQRKVFNKWYKPTKADAKKVLKAIEEGADIGDKSLEELL